MGETSNEEDSGESQTASPWVRQGIFSDSASKPN